MSQDRGSDVRWHGPLVPERSFGRLQRLGQIGAVSALKLRTARLINGAVQTISQGTTLTTVQFGASRTIGWNDLSIDAADDLDDLWDATNHQWQIPADAEYVSLYGEVRFETTTAAGVIEGAILQTLALGGTSIWGRAMGYFPSGVDPRLAIFTPFCEVEPGDTFEFQVYQNIEATLDLTDSVRFQIEIVEK